jgi:hypothetical protein
MTTTGVVVRLTRELVNTGRVTVVVDADGVGAGVFDRLREQFGGGGGAIVFPDGRGSLVGGGSGAEVVGFRASERAWRPDRFINRRAEMWWTLREAFRDGLIDIDAADEDLAAQLVAMRFTEDSKGRIQIESKADMKKRGLRSPDDADAVAMSLVGGHWRPAAVDRERDLLDRAEGMRVARLEARRGAVPARCLPPVDEILGLDELMSRPM